MEPLWRVKAQCLLLVPSFRSFCSLAWAPQAHTPLICPQTSPSQTTLQSWGGMCGRTYIAESSGHWSVPVCYSIHCSQIELRGNGLSDKPSLFSKRGRYWTIDTMTHSILFASMLLLGAGLRRMCRLAWTIFACIQAPFTKTKEGAALHYT
eukprot:scaffold58262_cov13-Tisochrysis_lutea.AAC.1